MTKFKYLLISKRKVFLLYGLLFSSLLVAIPFGVHGVFQDSSIYYENLIGYGEFDLISAIFTDYLSIEKFEPSMIVILWLLNKVANPNEFLFIVFCYSFVLMVLLYAGLNINSNLPIIIIVLVLISYWVVSKNLYFWKAIISYSVLVMALYSRCFYKKIALIVLAVLTHSSALLFVAIYLLVYTSKFFVKNLNIRIVLISLLICAAVLLPTENVLGPFSSRGNFEPYQYSGITLHSFQTAAALFLCIVYLFINKPSSNTNITLWVMLISIALSALVLVFNYYHFSMRLSMPSFLFAGFFYTVRKKSVNWRISSLLLFLSVIPTFRLILLMLTGLFEPA